MNLLRRLACAADGHVWDARLHAKGYRLWRPCRRCGHRDYLGRAQAQLILAGTPRPPAVTTEP